MPIGTVSWIEEGMLSDAITPIKPTEIGNVQGVCFGLRNQFLHGSHPLGWIRSFRVSLGGVPVPQQHLYFELRGQMFAMSQLPTLSDVWWQLGETATVLVRGGVHLSQVENTVECDFQVSALGHTPAIDWKDLRPRLEVSLKKTMRASGEHRRSTTWPTYA